MFCKSDLITNAIFNNNLDDEIQIYYPGRIEDCKIKNLMDYYTIKKQKYYKYEDPFIIRIIDRKTGNLLYQKY